MTVSESDLVDGINGAIADGMLHANVPNDIRATTADGWSTAVVSGRGVVVRWCIMNATPSMITRRVRDAAVFIATHA